LNKYNASLASLPGFLGPISVLALAASLLAPGIMAPMAKAETINLPAVDVVSSARGMKLYQVQVTRGKRRAVSGTEREYALFVPHAPEGMPRGPYPLVVFVHGFLMTGAQQAANAQNLAQRGFIVLTPNMTKVLLWDQNRMENVHDIIDHIQWLESGSSPVAGKIDRSRVAVAGNSSGGAVILEVALEAQKQHVPIAAICSLDGTIWDRTSPRISSIQPLKVLSLRCEPSLCNEHGRQLAHLQELKFPFDDVKVIGSQHCDVENPTTLPCSCICGTTNDKNRRIFAQLLYAWLRDNLNAPKFSINTPSFSQIVNGLQLEHRVAARLDRSVRIGLSSNDVDASHMH
jgi:hypothetical protein